MVSIKPEATSLYVRLSLPLLPIPITCSILSICIRITHKKNPSATSRGFMSERQMPLLCFVSLCYSLTRMGDISHISTHFYYLFIFYSPWNSLQRDVTFSPHSQDSLTGRESINTEREKLPVDRRRQQKSGEY